ncbi:MAG: hypothetical protein DMG30_09400 [Acidobacteria bacterium]|nr:MAG: hypothetical protein DMG30_09400 [Acidobacteriota bacterium]
MQFPFQKFGGLGAKMQDRSNCDLRRQNLSKLLTFRNPLKEQMGKNLKLSPLITLPPAACILSRKREAKTLQQVLLEPPHSE